ncbi:hypothetical protein BGZ95_006211 [Linnemannia exigua]|uniref:C2H2-type domain-containing protein n=1 Tax=Linnemannia exigua TaxID=604196 RepID=A0AAD4D185_9FUNG|nr:hypothetical protein BGZ95_006211 [Linnemannia exigua]
MQHYQSYPADTTYAPAMDPHYNNNSQNNGYSPSPAPMGPRSTPLHSISHTSHARTHSRSNSGAFPPMNNQGPYPPQQTQPPHIIDAPMSYQGNHPNQTRPYTNGPQGMSGYGSPPPQNYNTAPQDPHLHQRASHHAHPYHAPPPMTHSRTHSRSHSRSQSHSQQQFAAYPSIQSPPPPPPSALRHGSPVAPVAHPHSRYPQDGYMDSQVDPVRFPMQVPQPPAPRHMMDEQMHTQQLDREMSHGPMVPAVQEPLARATPAPAPVPTPAPAPITASAPTSAAPTAAEEEASDASKCLDCGKVYKHAASLQKHRWEHSAYWKPAAKFLLSKHQQVQLMEAAAILLGMDESRQSDKDPIVRMMSRQRGHGATGTSISSVSPATSTKSLSASPPPMAERALALKQETAGMMSPPAFIGRAANTTRHSVTSTTSTASSLSSTPPSLAPDDNESVIEAEDDMMMAPPSLRQPHQQHLQHHPQQQHHHVQQQQPHGLAHHQPHHQHPQQQLQQLHHQQQPPMMMDMEMRQKHSEPQFYQHDSRYPAYHQQPPQQHAEAYAPYYQH